ncbi:hypothetical protein AK88_05410 [Plasmodium fragile]|uniref:Schizont-infected cell agglutination C-terminal domain-containing protein n=1 Tax=Plasmodium fragile TaxID=5857 RepID=A0A0D9QD18_PLAFR|nr:uncharacterized protein AK88_05410 [Plasmodium fragile]KJP84955.1 hypothetical protein AK88_05410 [Plasmodium fragile]
MWGNNGHSSSLDAPTTNEGLSGTNVASTVDPSTDSDASPPHEDDPWSRMQTIPLATDRSPPNEDDPDPWRCMETIQLEPDPCPHNEDDPWSCMETIELATDPCPPNEEDPAACSCMQTIQLEPDPCAPHACDPWSCMETIQFATDPFPPNAEDRCNCMETRQLDAEQRRAHSDHGDATSACTQWIPWIERNKHIVRACTTQPWFNALKSEWQQYLREHMVATAPSGEAATLERKKDAWKEWVAKQHRQMSMYNAQEWFQRLLNTVEHETVPQHGQAPIVENDLEVEKVMAAEHILRVRDLPRTPLHQQPYMQQPLTAHKLCMLILASVIEECEIESSMHEKELYLDDLLQKLCN